MSARTGVLFSTRDDLDLVIKAEACGFESIWTAEGQGKTAFGKLERWATVTDEVKLATGIVDIFARTPATTAQAIVTLDAHSNGRAILGLGVAHPGVVEDFHGTLFDHPLGRMEEYVELVRRYLRGETAEFSGEFYTPSRTRFWESFDPPRTTIPIYNAALGPANVRLTGSRFDGWLPNLYPKDRFETAMGWLTDGVEDANRSIDDVDVAMYVLVSVSDDGREARDMVRRHIAYYLRDIPGYYGRVAANAGYEAEVQAAKTADSTAIAADNLTDELVDLLSVSGTPEAVVDGLEDLREIGVDLPIVRSPVSADRAVTERILELCSPG